ncbi:MAG TPA: hypothetical protein DD624_00705 [Alphaproteobacteria bacterium]|nr:hypothetical protein [Alphaproteobacteria bacterium]
MIKIVWNAVVLGIIALSAAWLSNNPGSVQMEWLGWRVQTSVAVVIGVFIVCYAVFYAFLAKPLLLLKNKILYWARADLRAEKMAKAKIGREVDRYTLLGKGLTALAAGDVETAKKLQKDIVKKFSDDEAKTLVFDAQLAEAQNDKAKAMELYAKLAEAPDTRLLGMRGKIRLFRLNGAPEKALKACEELLAEKNPMPWVLTEAFELQVQEKQWDKAVATLEKAYKTDSFDKKTFKHLKASVLLEQAAGTNDAAEKERLILEAGETDDSLIQAVLSAAALNAEKGEIRKARKQLCKLWKSAPCWAVYEAYQALTPEKPALDAVTDLQELLDENKDAEINALVKADASLKARLWGQAKGLLEKYLAVKPDSKRALLMMAEIAAANRDEKAAVEYGEKAAVAEPEPMYVCSVCKTPLNEWHTACPICHTLGTMSVKL